MPFNRSLLFAAVLLLIQNVQPAAGSDGDTSTGGTLVERGRYLALAGNCQSCHTREGGAPFAGGLAFATPFGTLYSTNITSDPEHGIGAWSEQQFAAAVREGVRPSGEHLYPAFPYTAFTRLSDEDISALFAYMKTVQPSSDAARENELGFPYNMRWGIGLWKWLYFDEGRFQADASRPADWNRGKYLVEGLGHCSACHSPRNFLGAERTDVALSGGTYKDKVDGRVLDWSATNLTSADSGVGQWSDDEIVQYLKLGFSARAGVFGPMNDVVVNSTRHLSDADLRAIAKYLKSVPPTTQESGPASDESTMQAGALQYDIHCGTCHLPTGLGSDTTGPPLVGSAVTLAADPASLINVTLHGPHLPSTPPSEEWLHREWQPMGAFGEKLTDEDAAALLSYIRGSWGNKAGGVTVEQVQKQR